MAFGHELVNTGVPNLFGEQPHLHMFGFPPLTRAYFASSRKNFNNVLSLTPRSAINDVDVYGRTALAWAVLRSDWNSANQLLLCGSDPGRVDTYGRTALHQAARRGDVAVVQLLLAAKADVASRDSNGNTALRLASGKQRSITIMETLLSAGANIESQNEEEFGPLHDAVRCNRPANVQFLLERGANINAASKQGFTVLMFGVHFNAHETLKILLRDEALEYDVKNCDGYSVLDFAALLGDVETLHLLQSAPEMTKINLDNSHALSHAQWRRDYNEAWSSRMIQPRDKDPVEWYSAFKALWDTIFDAQQRELEEDSEAGFIEEELTNDEEELTVHDEELTDNEDDPAVWEDAQENLDRPIV